MECCRHDAALQILLWPQQEYHDGRDGEPHIVAPSSVGCELCQPSPWFVNLRESPTLH